MLAAMSGAMRSAQEAGASPAMMRKPREHLVLLCQSYLAAAAGGRPRCAGSSDVLFTAARPLAKKRSR